MSAPLFQLGRLLATPGVLDATGLPYRLLCLSRHESGDFGTICAEDKAMNLEAIGNGDRILSAYAIDPAKPSAGFGDNTFWIITEADRSATTFLLPDEY